MNRLRWIILLLGPLPIVGCAMALNRWAEPAPPEPVERNHVFVTAPAGVDAASAPPDNERLLAECREKSVRWKARLGDDCDVIVRSPFVIGGNLSEERLQRWYERTIEPAARAMSQTYFDNQPDRAITVLLFSDRESYNEYTELLFGDRGISIYGYYKPSLRTLIMNIGTGGGTLVHELTHALIEFDFASVPDWFNEGLASLHEQCRFDEQDGRQTIIGLANWRLPALQSAIRSGELRTLESLIKDDDFRSEQVGLNYAQARYFCMYLQEHGKLDRFYRRFRDDDEDDKSGYRSITRILSPSELEQIDESFQSWVLELEFLAR